MATIRHLSTSFLDNQSRSRTLLGTEVDRVDSMNFGERIMLPPKTTMVALILFIGGAVFLLSGLVVFFQKSEDTGLPLLILGSISATQN